VKASKERRFFGKLTPTPLFRGIKRGDPTHLMQPTLAGLPFVWFRIPAGSKIPQELPSPAATRMTNVMKFPPSTTRLRRRMSESTLQALNNAMGSITFEREALLLRIESVSAEIEDEEQLLEQVVLNEQALGEFRGEYKALRASSNSYPAYEAIFAEGIRNAREFFKC
jgi:hypothetical protein